MVSSVGGISYSAGWNGDNYNIDAFTPNVSSSNSSHDGLFGGFNALFDFGLNSIMSNSANKKSKRAAMQSFLWQNYLMDKQNEYNKPINQMKRFYEAGLNPMLIYGQQNLSASPSSAPEATVHASRGELNLLQKMQIAQEIRQQNANIALTKSQTMKNYNDMELARAGLELKNFLGRAQEAYIRSGGRLRDKELIRWAQVDDMIREAFGGNTGSGGTSGAASGQNTAAALRFIFKLIAATASQH